MTLLTRRHSQRAAHRESARPLPPCLCYHSAPPPLLLLSVVSSPCRVATNSSLCHYSPGLPDFPFRGLTMQPGSIHPNVIPYMLPNDVHRLTEPHPRGEVVELLPQRLTLLVPRPALTEQLQHACGRCSSFAGQCVLNLLCPPPPSTPTATQQCSSVWVAWARLSWCCTRLSWRGRMRHHIGCGGGSRRSSATACS